MPKMGALNALTSPRTWVIVAVVLVTFYVLAMLGKDPLTLAQQQQQRVAA